MSLLLFVIVHTLTDAALLALLALVGQVFLPTEFARLGARTVLVAVIVLATVSALVRLVRRLAR